MLFLSLFSLLPILSHSACYFPGTMTPKTHVRLIGYSKLAVGVNMSGNGCVSPATCVLPCDSLDRLHHTHNWISRKKKNRYMEVCCHSYVFSVNSKPNLVGNCHSSV